MKKHALLKDNVVVRIEIITEDQCVELSREYQLLIDISEQNPEPQVGWTLSGNSLVAHSGSLSLEELDSIQQTKQREFGIKLATHLVDMMGSKNLTLTRQGETVNVTTLLTQLSSIKSLLESGAIKTAKGLILYIYASFPVYQSILDYAISEINSFLTSNGY